ncbi:MAG: methyltransferase domain-containing protein [Deltaproteobacteria bacterium]|nr:methyltransferase domain-containing protein [Deltaproteobacteria bacterium]
MYFIHYSCSFQKAAEFLLGSHKKGKIIDLGCGCGTQSIYLASKGADVLGLDMDTRALKILKKRKRYYEESMKKELSIKVEEKNSFEFEYEKAAPIAGMYSMFAFNMMQPSGRLVDKIDRFMNKGSRIAIIDGNNMAWYSRIAPWRRRDVWSPTEFESELTERGYRIVSHTGGITLPAAFWAVAPFKLLEEIDTWMSAEDWIFPISHQILAEKL